MLSADLRDALAGGATVVTATRRLARWISAAHDAEQQRAGRAAWEPADVLPWPSWQRRTWLRLRDWGGIDDDARLLGAMQARVLWRQVLDDLPPLRGAVLPGDAVGACERAWRLAQAWELTPARIAGEGGEDARLFAGAAAAFAEVCRGTARLDPGALPGRLARARPAALAAALPPRLAFVGFDSPAPAQRRLEGLLREAGIEVLGLATAAPPRDARPRRLACDDPDAELRAAAAWARARLESAPETRIGLVLAQSEERMERVAEVLDDVLSPRRVLPGRGGSAPAWNLYLDRPLNAWPVVATALRALSFVCDGAPLSELGLLLRSPWLGGGGAEADARSRLDARLRRRGYFELDVDALLGELTDDGARGCPTLAAALRRGRAVLAEGRKRQGPEGWAQRFAAVLGALGWPGRELDSAEYQTVCRWREALVEFGGLDLPGTGLDASQALGELGRLLGEIRFQPEREPAPVQVTGLLDAVGLGFDACWVAGLHDAVWPRPLNPDPLIPAGLQRRLGMPRADAALEREFAARLTGQLSACADEVVFSWPAREDDRTLRASPLLAGLPAAERPPSAVLYAEGLLAAGRLEAVDDFRLPPAAAADGGTGRIQHQALCPFRAQAVHRLRAEPLETPRPGVDRRSAGALLHRALERLWGEWMAQSGLPGDAAAAAAVESTLAGLVRGLPPAVRRGREALLEIERERLQALIEQWLAVERERPPFRVEAREATLSTRLGPLELAVRIDRIDRLADGGLVVIDYKSGAASVSDWLHERPPEPQLPIYALALGGEVAAVAVASLKAGAIGLRGLGRDSDLAPGIEAVAKHRAAARVADDWEGLTGRWREWLEALAEEHRAGEAAVRPRAHDTCRYCHLTILCRRHELAAAETADDDA